MNSKHKLTDLRLWKETDSKGVDHHYLYLEYIVRKGDEVYKHIYPKVVLGIDSDHIPMELTDDEELFIRGAGSDISLTFQDGNRYQALPTTVGYINRYGEKIVCKNSYRITEHLTQDVKKPKKMTKEEIEKALGYEIELVDA